MSECFAKGSSSRLPRAVHRAGWASSAVSGWLLTFSGHVLRLRRGRQEVVTSNQLCARSSWNTWDLPSHSVLPRAGDLGTLTKKTACFFILILFRMIAPEMCQPFPSETEKMVAPGMAECACAPWTCGEGLHPGRGPCPAIHTPHAFS